MRVSARVRLFARVQHGQSIAEFEGISYAGLGRGPLHTIPRGSSFRFLPSAHQRPRTHGTGVVVLRQMSECKQRPRRVGIARLRELLRRVDLGIRIERGIEEFGELALDAEDPVVER